MSRFGSGNGGMPGGAGSLGGMGTMPSLGAGRGGMALGGYQMPTVDETELDSGGTYADGPFWQRGDGDGPGLLGNSGIEPEGAGFAPLQGTRLNTFTKPTGIGAGTGLPTKPTLGGGAMFP